MNVILFLLLGVVAIVVLVTIMILHYEKSKNQGEDLDETSVPWERPIAKTSKYLIYRDGFPVTHGHLLFVPRKNNAEYIEKCFAAALYYGNKIVEEKTADSFNIGINCGEEAGQTVMWPHVHLIPRRKGDMENPTGGVRHVIPEQGNYKTGTYKKP